MEITLVGEVEEFIFRLTNRIMFDDEGRPRLKTRS